MYIHTSINKSEQSDLLDSVLIYESETKTKTKMLTRVIDGNGCGNRDKDTASSANARSVDVMKPLSKDQTAPEPSR